MRRDVRRHTNGDTRRSIDQQVREACRQNNRLFERIIVVRLKINRLFIKVAQQFHRWFIEAGFGITHSSSRIAVDRAEVSMAIDQGNAHREPLSQADHRVVNCSIAMRMILTDHVTNGTCRLSMRTARCDAAFVHRVEDTTMNRLQAIAHIGQCTRNDNAHRVFKKRCAHLLAQFCRKDI